MTTHVIRSALRLFGAGLIVASGWITAGPVDASSDADPFPQLVVTTPDGPMVITLARDDAPQHVAALLAAVDAGNAGIWHVDRVSAGGYVQLGSASAVGLVGLPNETGDGIGNVAGAVSVYDGPDALPTLLIALTDSRHLDATYTPIGWVESGRDRVDALSRVAAGPGGVPTADHTVGPLRRDDAAAVALIGTTDRAGLPLASIVLTLVSAAAVAAIGLALPRLDRGLATTLLLSAAFVGFFAAWSAAIGRTSGRPATALAMFVLAIAMFRAMGRFEQPRQGARRSMRQPPATGT